MTPSEIQDMRNKVKAYSDKKKLCSLEIKSYEAAYEEGRIPHWSIDLAIEELYIDLFQTEERKNFLELAAKTGTDPVFERHFSAAFVEYFL